MSVGAGPTGIGSRISRVHLVDDRDHSGDLVRDPHPPIADREGVRGTSNVDGLRHATEPIHDIQISLERRDPDLASIAHLHVADRAFDGQGSPPSTDRVDPKDGPLLVPRLHSSFTY